MVSDQQVRRLMTFINKKKSLVIAAARAGMDEKTARKYRKRGKLPFTVEWELKLPSLTKNKGVS